MKALFNAKYYREAGTFTNPEDGLRYGVDCVRIEPHPVKGVLIIATEGHVLGIWHDEQGQCAGPVMIRFDKALDAVCGASGNEWEASRHCLQVNDDGSVALLEGTPSQPGRDVAVFHNLVSHEKFPTWRKVLPDTETPRMDINPKYVGLFAALSKETFPGLALWISPQSGTDSNKKQAPATISVRGRDDFVGCVMGMVQSGEEWPGAYFDSLRADNESV